MAASSSAGLRENGGHEQLADPLAIGPGVHAIGS
jgi:hypothetical protein